MRSAAYGVQYYFVTMILSCPQVCSMLAGCVVCGPCKFKVCMYVPSRVHVCYDVVGRYSLAVHVIMYLCMSDAFRMHVLSAYHACSDVHVYVYVYTHSLVLVACQAAL